MIVQNVGHDGLTDFSFTVHRNDYRKALEILKPVREHIKAREIVSGDTIAKVSIVGVGMRSHAGIASTAFRALAEEGINIQMISTSEIKISVVIDEKYTELAVRVLHKVFSLDQALVERRDLRGRCDILRRLPERWPSGRRRAPAKGVWEQNPIEGSNPSLSAS